MKLRIYGAKHTKGEVEGNAFDFVKIFALARMERKATQVGGAGVDFRGLPELAPKLLNIDLWNGGHGVECDVDMETMALGGGNMREVIVSIDFPKSTTDKK